MEKIIIAAMAENRVIGINGQLPWRIPEDLKHFKQLTWGYPVIMGRKTWESLGSKPLPGRQNIVLSKGLLNYCMPKNSSVSTSLVNTFDKLEHEGNKKAYVIGGAEVYEQALPLVDKLEMTLVFGKYEGDTLFPLINWREWNRELVEIKDGYAFGTYTRRRI